LKRKNVYVRTENRADQLKKTDRKNRTTYTYRYHRTEKNGAKVQDITEEVTFIPGEDGVTKDDIKFLHSLDDHDVYENLKAKKPKREDWEQKIIDDYQADFIKKFKERNGYDPDPAYVASILDEIFPKNWTASIEELTEGEADDDCLGDKSSIMDSARSIFGAPHKKTPAEERLAELRDTWSDSWKEIYDRVLLGGESIVSIARERDVNESAVRKTTNKIRKAIAEDPELNRLMK